VEKGLKKKKKKNKKKNPKKEKKKPKPKPPHPPQKKNQPPPPPSHTLQKKIFSPQEKVGHTPIKKKLLLISLVFLELSSAHGQCSFIGNE